MFTGIIDHCGKIRKIQRQSENIHIWIQTQFSDISLGESIAVDGVCLTVAALTDDCFRCDLSPETLSCTAFAAYSVGQLVNLERALRLQDRLGGHMVSGHVDQTAKLYSQQMHDEYLALHFTGITSFNKNYLIPKGSVSVNGVSLTINAIEQDGFSVMLIPHTQQVTNLKQLKIGDRVNMEYDQMTKTIVRTVYEISKNTSSVC